jgi:hypothetical protein
VAAAAAVASATHAISEERWKVHYFDEQNREQEA